jgi:hypothetical protein
MKLGRFTILSIFRLSENYDDTLMIPASIPTKRLQMAELK